MNARITIQSGIATGTSHLVTGRVARVGSDPQSEICLPTAEIPEHALTLEFNNKTCKVYNRCRSSIQIGSHVVEADEVASWTVSDVLLIGSDIELAIDFDIHEGNDPYLEEIDDDPSSDISVTEDQPSPTTPSEKSGSGAKTIMQLAVTMLCIVACAFLLLREQNKKATTLVGADFSSIVSEGVNDPDVPRELIQRIQYAEAQRIRGRIEVANARFRMIRDDLVARLDVNKPTMGQFEDDALSFVQSRLQDSD